jgi:hypothetical protein
MGSALISTFACAGPGSAPGVPYLRIVGAPAVTLTAAPPKVGALGKVGALEGPEIVVFRQVGLHCRAHRRPIIRPHRWRRHRSVSRSSGCLGQRGRARERDGSGQCDCREFHGCVLSICISRQMWGEHRPLTANVFITLIQSSATGRLLPPFHRHRTNHHAESRAPKKSASVFVRFGVPGAQLPPVRQRRQRLQLHQQSAVRSHGVRPACRLLPQLLRQGR